MPRARVLAMLGKVMSHTPFHRAATNQTARLGARPVSPRPSRSTRHEMIRCV
jgi:hypothetical protein